MVSPDKASINLGKSLANWIELPTNATRISGMSFMFEGNITAQSVNTHAAASVNKTPIHGLEFMLKCYSGTIIVLSNTKCFLVVAIRRQCTRVLKE
jgi:hypothetical protein